MVRVLLSVYIDCYSIKLPVTLGWRFLVGP